MNSAKTYVILLLAATTLGGAMLAWRQYGELVELRAANMNRDERADLHRRVWELEKLNRDLQDQLAARRNPATDVENLLAGADAGGGSAESRERPGWTKGGRGDPRGRSGNPLQQVTAIQELMSKPEVQAMLSFQQKAAIEQRYAALFKNLNLPPDQVERLKTLLAERETTVQDVMAAARTQGLNPRDNPDAFRKMIADAQNQINEGIKATIGDNGFSQLTSYEQTLPQRNLVNELQQRLSYTNTPLTAAQAEQMVQILAATAPARSPGPPPGGAPAPSRTGGADPGRGPGGFGPPGGPGGRGPGPDIGGLVAGVLGGGPSLGMLMGGPDAGRSGGIVTVTPAAVAQAQTVLAPTQLAALQQIQQQQQTQQQLRQLVNDTLAANQPQPPKNAAPTPGNASGGTTGTPPPRKRPGGG